MKVAEPKVRNFKGEIDYTEGGIVSKQILKNKCGNVTLFSFDKGQALSEHTAPYDALVKIVEGKADVILDGDTYSLTEGEFIILPANIPHAVKANSAFKMLLTMIRDNN